MSIFKRAITALREFFHEVLHPVTSLQVDFDNPRLEPAPPLPPVQPVLSEFCKYLVRLTRETELVPNVREGHAKSCNDKLSHALGAASRYPNANKTQHVFADVEEYVRCSWRPRANVKAIMATTSIIPKMLGPTKRTMARESEACHVIGRMVNMINHREMNDEQTTRAQALTQDYQDLNCATDLLTKCFQWDPGVEYRFDSAVESCIGLWRLYAWLLDQTPLLHTQATVLLAEVVRNPACEYHQRKPYSKAMQDQLETYRHYPEYPVTH